jgi:PhoPQ-activated pathogenicity-related protein
MSPKTLFVFAICALLVIGSSAGRRKSPIEKYVYSDDDAFDWEQVGTIQGDVYTAFLLNMTSQNWLTAADSSQPVWSHILTVCVPHNVEYNTAFLYVDGGDNTDPLPTTVYNIVEYVCRNSPAVSVYLAQVPNQPISFPSDATHAQRKEDAIIAYTWEHFLKNTSSDPNWLLQFPQVKSAVRAMDAVQEFTDTLDIPRVKSFIMGGASKRGWTTWLASGIDKRVEAFIPVVMPILNIKPNLDNAFRSLGGWTWTFADYWAAGVMSHFGRPEFDAMAALIDPINFNDKFTPKPTYVIASSQDEFFQPDAANFFFQQLRGEKYLRILPGSGHTFYLTYNLTDVLVSVNSFVRMVGDNLRGPRDLSWSLYKTPTRTQQASIGAVSGTRPKKVVMWSANTISTTRRDFRLFACVGATGVGCYQNLNWTATDITPQYGSIYTASRKAPAAGWGIFYLEFTYDIEERGRHGDKHEFKVSTEVNIVPDVLPFPSCGTSCGAEAQQLANPGR